MTWIHVHVSMPPIKCGKAVSQLHLFYVYNYYHGNIPFSLFNTDILMAPPSYPPPPPPNLVRRAIRVSEKETYTFLFPKQKLIECSSSLTPVECKKSQLIVPTNAKPGQTGITHVAEQSTNT